MSDSGKFNVINIFSNIYYYIMYLHRDMLVCVEEKSNRGLSFNFYFFISCIGIAICSQRLRTKMHRDRFFTLKKRTVIIKMRALCIGIAIWVCVCV